MQDMHRKRVNARVAITVEREARARRHAGQTRGRAGAKTAAEVVWHQPMALQLMLWPQAVTRAALGGHKHPQPAKAEHGARCAQQEAEPERPGSKIHPDQAT